MMSFELLLSDWRGLFVLGVAALTLIFFIAIAVSKPIKSKVLNYGIPVTFVCMLLWFVAGGHYATMWTYGKWGTFETNASHLAEFFDGSVWGFVVSFIFTFSFLAWQNKANKKRSKNPKVNWNV